MESLERVMARRSAANEAVLRGLNHLPRDHAIRLVLSWIPLDELEAAIPTLAKPEEPVTDPVEAFAHRLQFAALQRGVGVEVRVTRRKSLSREDGDRIAREVVREALGLMWIMSHRRLERPRRYLYFIGEAHVATVAFRRHPFTGHDDVVLTFGLDEEEVTRGKTESVHLSFREALTEMHRRLSAPAPPDNKIGRTL